MPAQPVCFACRRPLDEGDGDLVLTIDSVAEVAQLLAAPPRQMTAEEERRLVDEYSALSICRGCGRPR